MLYPFESFKDNWITHTDIHDLHAREIKYSMHLSDDFFTNLALDKDSLEQYKIKAAKFAHEKLGKKPALCLSGGVDSQAMIQCWQQAEIDFDTIIMVFNDDLNSQDVNHARKFCEYKSIVPIEININIVSFLTREHMSYAEKYRCTSPHFTTHYKMYDILIEMGYTGICAGGTAFAKNYSSWGPVLSAAQLNYIEYSRINQIPVMGNFLGYDPELCWSIAILTPPHDSGWKISATESLDDATKNRYDAKVTGYTNHGFDVLPQATKYTGFEKVKTYFADKYKDGWAFEKKFRLPLYRKFTSATGSNLTLSNNKLEILDGLQSQYFASSD